MKAVLLLPLASPALAILSYTSNTICTTKYGTTSRANVPTVVTHNPTTTLYIVSAKQTSISTVTPPASTSWTATTTTSTNIVDTQSTDIETATYTTTQTDTAFSTTTSTSTFTTTSTSTSQSTTTISTSAGFTPIAAQTDYVAKRAEGHARREAALEEENQRRAAKSVQKLVAPKAGATSAASQYKSAVTCGITTSEYTTVNGGTTTSTTTLTAQTVTSTSTVSTSVDSTSTLAPTTTYVVVTAYATTTSTSTVSTSTTMTQTNTAIVPQSTFYAQCDSSNLISHVHSGTPIGFLSYSSAYTLYGEAMNDATGYSCCARCASLPSCAGFGQNPTGTCYYIMTSGQCDPSQTWNDGYHYYSTPNGNTYVVGNGGCGRLGAISGST